MPILIFRTTLNYLNIGHHSNPDHMIAANAYHSKYENGFGQESVRAGTTKPTKWQSDETSTSKCLQRKMLKRNYERLKDIKYNSVRIKRLVSHALQ